MPFSARSRLLPLLATAALAAGCARGTATRDILFQALRPGDSEDVYALDSATGEVRRLTVGAPDHAHGFPVRSPAGDEIALVRQARHDTLFLMPAAGGEMRPLFAAAGPRLGPPAWSPDGTEILLAAGGREGDRRLHAVRADGGGSRELALPPGDYDCASWSPGGDRIVATRRSGGTSAVVAVRPGTPGVEVLVASDSARYHCPEWSPDGGTVAVSVYRADYAEARIALLDLESRELAPLDTGPGVNNAPRWSPGGRWLVYQCTEMPAVPADPDGARAFYRSMEICAIRRDGSGRRRLTRNDHFDAHPSW